MKSTLLALVNVFGSAVAWGAEGHEIVGSIAQSFLSKDAQSQLASILSESNGDLAAVSNWADKVKFTGQYAITRPWHYIDAQDTPPTQCDIQESRDCADGNCIVGAIAKYSKEALCGSDAQVKTDAIKFLVHFFGDISQPLHVENRNRGGNGDKVTFDGKNTDLHAVWDVSLVQSQIGKHSSSQTEYVDYLISQIKSGSFAVLSKSWLSSHSWEELSKFGNSLAAIDYATDSNKYDCGPNGVWSSYLDNPSQDLSGKYAEIAAPVVDVQLAKAGFRLGKFLSELLSATCDSPSPSTPPPSKSESESVPSKTKPDHHHQSSSSSTKIHRRPKRTQSA